MNTNFFVAEDEVFNPNKVLTRKQMDAFIGDRGIKSYAGVLKKDNKLFYNFIRLTHSHPLRSGILALCNKRWLEVFLRNRVEFTAMFELTLDLLNYGLSPFVQQFQ